MQKDHRNDTRLWPHPETRFVVGALEIDLLATATRLQAEPPAGERGHRQETLYHQRGLTIVLFLCGRFTQLPEHHISGIVNMHVLLGRVKVTAAGHLHELRPGQMLILAPGVRHAVIAEKENEMLVTIWLMSTTDVNA